MAEIYFDVDTALSEVPVNIAPLIDDTDFKTIEGAVAYNAAGMALRWHFVTSAGAYTVTSVTPTTAGNYDWTDQGDSGIYTIEIPASGGASINNDTEGYGWFTGVATGVLPWRSPIYGFRAAAINDSWIDANTTGFLAPTTAGRTLDVASTGEAGIDLGNALVPVGAIPWLGIMDNGVAQAASGTAATIRAAASFAADDLIGMTYASGNNSRIISDNDASDGLTVASAFISDPGAAPYYIFGTPPGSNFEAGLADGAITAAKIATGAITAAKFAAGAIDAASIATDAITNAKIAANAIGSAEIATGAITSATFAAGAIDAAAIAANAIGASELAADAATEIAAAVLSAATSTPIAANMEQINTVPVTGDGSGTPFAV